MISRTFHSYKFCKTAHKFTIKEHLFTSGHKTPRHIHDMGVGTPSAIIKSQQKFQCFFGGEIEQLGDIVFHKMKKKEKILWFKGTFFNL